MTQPTVS